MEETIANIVVIVPRNWHIFFVMIFTSICISRSNPSSKLNQTTNPSSAAGCNLTRNGNGHTTSTQEPWILDFGKRYDIVGRRKNENGGKRKKTADTETGTKSSVSYRLIVDTYRTSRPEREWQLEIMIMINHDVHIYYVSD